MLPCALAFELAIFQAKFTKHYLVNLVYLLWKPRFDFNVCTADSVELFLEAKMADCQTDAWVWLTKN